MRKILSIALAMVLLASAVPLAVTPAAAYEKKIPGDADGTNELTKEELVNAILPYMLDEGALTLDDVGDAAYVYAYWDGNPKMITDQLDRKVTLYRPVERVALACTLNCVRVIINLGAKDKIVAPSTVVGYLYDEPGRSKYFSPLPRAAPELKELPRISYRDPSLEFIVALKPDAIIGRSPSQTVDAIQEGTGIPTVGTKSTGGDLRFGEHRLIGKIVGREEEAEELISYVNEELDKLTEVTSQIPDNEKPTVLVLWKFDPLVRYDPIEIAGGINMAKDCVGASGGKVQVSKEQIIAWNPDIIFKYHTKAALEEITSDPDFQTLNAVKNDTVYPHKGCMIGWDAATVTTEAFYFAKLFHPETFKDLDVEKKGNEIMERLYGVDGLYTEMTDGCGLCRWKEGSLQPVCPWKA